MILDGSKKGVTKMANKKARFNIIDLVVILVAVIAIGYAAYAVVVSLGDTGETVNVEYVIESEVIRKDVVMTLSEGDAVYAEDGTYMGKVKYCEVVPAKMEGVDAEGKTVLTDTEDYTLLLTVDVSTTSKKSGYAVGDMTIACGERYSLRCPSLAFEGACVSVKALNTKN